MMDAQPQQCEWSRKAGSGGSGRPGRSRDGGLEAVLPALPVSGIVLSPMARHG